VGATIDQFDKAFLRGGVKDREGLDVRVEAELLELGENPFGVVPIVRRTDVVRPGAEALHVGAEVLRAGNGAKLFFPLAFGAGGVGRVPIKRRFVGGDVRFERCEASSCKE
jgi:hypothetical protein